VSYACVLLDVNVQGHYRTGDTLAQFWKVPDHERRAIWGKSIDITSEPRHNTCDQWEDR
jgi:hypothetical protein